MSKFTCPVCGSAELTEDPAQFTYEICGQCGVEFGVEDPTTYGEIAKRWKAAGKPRFDARNPRTPIEKWKEIWHE